MAKRCSEEFNPWPPFVDIFSSVILVLLLFLLITIVNIAYYAQFKFKVSYTGTIPTNEVILSENPTKVVTEKKVQTDQIEQPLYTKPLKPELIEDPQTKEEVGDIESAGKDLSRIYEDEKSKQATIAAEDYLVLNFGGNDIKLDNPTIMEIKGFITQVKEKYPKHVVKISAVDPTNQISATVMKQISLARTINARNLIRQLSYDIKDVQVDLLRPNSTNIQNVNEFGFLIIRIEKK
ncbi:MAG: SGNH/GDSL hydrolase family protein [Arcobacteraceae bacterium]